eukprot:GHRR01029177.1.p1 GENE.GHRR01029177.1~~GHRR01029177.1.p1  ORF type:complete len:106 (-),score=17.23 GHRR01029177.1:240-557(-)
MATLLVRQDCADLVLLHLLCLRSFTAAILDAIEAGQLKHNFLIGGCDAAEPSRRYYNEMVKGLPQDTMVLTLNCGKYRFYDQDLGQLPNGLPRLLDMGQVRNCRT